MCAPVVACVEAPPIFESAEHILDFMAPAVEIFVKVGG